MNEEKRNTGLPYDFSELPEEELELIIKTAEKEMGAALL